MPAMIRFLGPVDAVRVAALRGSDWAAKPLGGETEGYPSFFAPTFLWERMRLRRSSVCLVSVEKGRVTGMVSVRRRCGPTAWTVDHLVTTQSDEETTCDLLEKAATYSSRRGAERLFLDLPDEVHLQRSVCASGFRPSAQVLLLTLPGRSPLLGVEPARDFRRRLPVDDYPLFRLYNATTPAEVRLNFGLTLQQWKDAQEPPDRGTRELVLERAGDVKGWLRLDNRGRWTKVRLVVHPDLQVDLQSIVSYVLRESQRRTTWWEVPEYQEALRLTLERMGFEVNRCYRLMVKSLDARVKEPSWAPVPTSV